MIREYAVFTALADPACATGTAASANTASTTIASNQTAETARAAGPAPAARTTVSTAFTSDFPVLTGGPARTITTGLAEYVTVTGTTWGLMAATAMMTLVPAIVFLGLVQRHIVAGLTFGAVKE